MKKQLLEDVGDSGAYPVPEPVPRIVPEPAAPAAMPPAGPAPAVWRARPAAPAIKVWRARVAQPRPVWRVGACGAGAMLAVAAWVHLVRAPEPGRAVPASAVTKPAWHAPEPVSAPAPALVLLPAPPPEVAKPVSKPVDKPKVAPIPPKDERRQVVRTAKGPPAPKPRRVENDPAASAATTQAATQAETLRQCRAAGYHASQCLRRACVVTRYGLACRG